MRGRVIIVVAPGCPSRLALSWRPFRLLPLGQLIRLDDERCQVVGVGGIHDHRRPALPVAFQSRPVHHPPLTIRAPQPSSRRPAVAGRGPTDDTAGGNCPSKRSSQFRALALAESISPATFSTSTPGTRRAAGPRPTTSSAAVAKVATSELLLASPTSSCCARASAAGAFIPQVRAMKSRGTPDSWHRRLPRMSRTLAIPA